jgi:hypothetical protein
LVSFGHCVVCPSFDLRLLIALWYLLAIVLSVLPLIYTFWLPFVISKGQSEVVNQRKDRQYNGQNITKDNQKPSIKGRTDNTMAKRYQRTIKSRKSKEGQTTQWLKDIALSVLPLIYGFWLPFGIFWPLCCLSFLWFTASDCPLVSFGHCVVCPSFELRLLIALTIQWPKDTKGQSEAVNQRKDRQHNGQKIPKGNQKP